MHSLYNVTTGLFTGQQLAGPPEFLADHTPPGHALWPGDVDSRRWAVGANGALVPHQPPAPPDTAWHVWQWDAAAWAWVAAPTTAALDTQARKQRAALLAGSDWVCARAYEQQTPVPPAWVAYRQALRDLPDSPGWPAAPDWPEPPA